jgi:hypothetical protein
MPALSRVIRTRDVVFMPLGRSGRKSYPDERTLRQLVTVLDIEDTPPSDEEVEEALYLPTRSKQDFEEIEDAENAENQLINEH